MEEQVRLQLDDGSHIAVVGGGPAGSFFSYFILEMAGRVGLDLQVDIYEPKDFSSSGPKGCNQCGGIVHESLVQLLATEGINLPPTVVQRGIDSHILHMGVGSVQIETPFHEMRIGAMYRGAGPRGLNESAWGSLDGYLLSLAAAKGANVIHRRVSEVNLNNGRPQLSTRDGSPQAYDLLVVAAGVNTTLLKLFEELGFGYQPPRTMKTAVREYYLGEETIGSYLGNSVHVFLLNIPRLKFACLIPKGGHVTVCLVGEGIDKELVEAVLKRPEVEKCFPPGFPLDQPSCQCWPRIALQGAAQPFTDRIVFLGDCGVTRFYKDGIGSAYRAAKAAAATAVFQGISAEDFGRHYGAVCRRLGVDNAIGKLVFAVIRQIQKRRFARGAVVRMVSRERQKDGRERRLSMVMWDMYTGGSPYLEILLRTLHPAFWVPFLGDCAVSLVTNRSQYPDIDGQSP